MNYALLMTQLLYSALADEEAELARLTGSFPVMHSVRMYPEHWLQYLFNKRSLQLQSCPKVGIEYDKIDMLFLNGDSRLAAFELKGPFSCAKKEWIDKIIGDCNKQCRALDARPGTRQYIVVVPCGTAEQIAPWLESDLLPAVRSAVGSVPVSEPTSSPRLPLNQRGYVLQVITFELKQRASSDVAVTELAKCASGTA